MKVGMITGGIPSKRVPVFEISDEDTDDDILEFAMQAAGETRTRLFGWDIVRVGDNTSYAKVVLWTD